MQEKLIKLRIFHVCILFAFSIFLYQYLPIEDSIWIPITVIAILGPYRPGLSIDKAQERVIGTLSGLIISIPVMIFIRYNPELLFIFAIILVFLLGLSVLQSYRYFIMLVTVVLCLNYNYMNLPVIDFNQTYFLVNRIAAVTIGVIVFYLAEFLFFKKYYKNAMTSINHAQLQSELNRAAQLFLSSSSSAVYLTCNELTEEVESLAKQLIMIRDAKKSAVSGFSDQKEFIEILDEYITIMQSLIILYTQWGFLFITSKSGSSVSSKRADAEDDFNSKFLSQYWDKKCKKFVFSY